MGEASSRGAFYPLISVRNKSNASADSCSAETPLQIKNSDCVEVFLHAPYFSSFSTDFLFSPFYHILNPQY